MNTPYDKTRRSDAASKGWQTRREALKLPDYGSYATPAAASDTEDMASDLPTTRESLFGGIASWPDPVFDVDQDGYRLIHNCFPVVETINKLAIRTAKLNWTVVGEGERADAVRVIIEQVHGWTDMIEWLTWAKVDGVRFMQIKSAPSRPGIEEYTIPDFWMGGRKKYKAGGEVQWDGTRLVMRQRTTGVAHTEPEELPIDQFIIHRPGAGSNPEGDSNIATAVYRIAHRWEDASKNMDAHMELFGVPIMVFKHNISQVVPTGVQSALTQAAQRITSLRNNKAIAISDEQLLELLEPKGQGFKDMIEYSMYLEGLIDQLFLGNTLTSKTNEGGRTGNTMTHKLEEDDAVFQNAMQIAETLNRHLLPRIFAKNSNIPALKDGENEVFIFPSDPNEDDEQLIEQEDPDDPGVSPDPEMDQPAPSVEEVEDE